MGAENARAVMSQNIVAICDCDLGLLDGKLAQWTRQAQAPPADRAAGAAASDRRRARSRLRAVEGAARRQREVAGAGRAPPTCCSFVERTDPAAEEVPRLPGDARQAERHRRGHRRDAGSHARRHRLGRDGRRQARLRPEAALLVGARSAAPGRRRRPRTKTSSRRWATSATRATSSAAASSTSWRARSARSAKCTCGRTGRSGFWPQGVPRPGGADRAIRPASAGTTAASRSASRRRWTGPFRSRAACRGTCFSASRPRCRITRFITRSTGAAGWTGARARSATWART